MPNIDKAGIPYKKISRYLLLPGAKHSKEFFDLGYTEQDAEQLYSDIMREIEKNKANEISGKFYGNRRRYSVIITLGKTKKRKFITVCQMIDGIPTFITAHKI